MNNKSLRAKNGIWIVLALLVIGCAAAVAALSGHLFRSVADSDLTIDLIPGSEEQAFRTLPLSHRAETGGAASGARVAALGAGSSARVVRLSNEAYIIEDEHGTVWNTDTQIDIFKSTYENSSHEITVAGENGRKVIAPGTENDYTFSLRNNGTGALDYKMTMNAFFTGLPDGKIIPVEVRVSSMNGWLLGDDTTWAPVLELATVEDSAVLQPSVSAVYTLEWRWPYDGGQDDLDTWLASQNEDFALTIGIDTQSSYHLPEIPAVTSPIPELLNGVDHFAYIRGYEDGTIRPNANITRGEAATIFYRLLWEDVRAEHLSVEHPYPDIPEDAWYLDEVATMTSLGILKGYEDGTFRGDQTITRAEFATVVARLSTRVLAANAKTEFPDIDGHWAAEEIMLNEQLNWVLGYDDGTFRPDSPITRAEAMAIVNRVLHRMPERTEDILTEEMHLWPDNSDPQAWYFLDVQEATHSHNYTRLRGTREKWDSLMEGFGEKTPTGTLI